MVLSLSVCISHLVSLIECLSSSTCVDFCLPIICIANDSCYTVSGVHAGPRLRSKLPKNYATFLLLSIAV